MSDSDLSFKTTNELINELQDRHDAFVYAGVQYEFKHKDNPHRYLQGWSGGCISCQGLVDLLKRRLDRATDEMDELPSDGDDPQSQEFNVS